MTASKPNNLPKTPCPSAIAWVVAASTYEYGGKTNIELSQCWVGMSLLCLRDSEKVHWDWAWVSNGETWGRCIQRRDSWGQIMSSFVGQGRETVHVLTRSCEPVGQEYPVLYLSPFPLPWACSPRLLLSKCCQSFLFCTRFSWWGGVTFKSQETVYIKKKKKTQNCDLFWKNSKDVTLAVCSMVTAAGVCNCEDDVTCTLCWSLLLLTFPEPWNQMVFLCPSLCCFSSL